MSDADYDQFAVHFDTTRKQPWKEVTDFLESLQGTFLDIGCGNGRHLIEAERRGLKAAGIDISRNMLKIAKRKTGSPLVLADALALPFKNCAFGHSACVAVVHHFKKEGEREKCLAEIVRVTKKACLISAWAFEQEKFKARKMQDVQLGWNKEHPRFYHLFREGELEKLARNARVRILKSFRSGNNYWLLLSTTNKEIA